MNTDHRTTRDGVMVADIGFKKQLWTLDKELDVVWDWSGERWEIWRFPGQAKKVRKLKDPRATHVMTIQTQGRAFKELGADILLSLQAGDTQRFSTKELVAYFDALDDNLQRSRERNLRAKIEAITYDNFDWMRGVLKVQVPKMFTGATLLEGPTPQLKMRRAISNA